MKCIKCSRVVGSALPYKIIGIETKLPRGSVQIDNIDKPCSLLHKAFICFQCIQLMGGRV